MIELTHLAAISFSDTDAGSFLHSQLSADVLSLDNGGSTFACYCEPKGRVLALMLVQKVNDAYMVIMSRKLATTVVERLKIYRMRSRVKIENLEGYAILGFPERAALERELNDVATVQIPNHEEKIIVTTQESMNAPDIDSQKDWKFSELSRGITWLNQETSGEFLPQMLGFEELGAVNYKKGCYPGQEIVARTHYLGKVKRHPRILSCKLENCPKPMDKIRISDGEQAYDAVVADCETATDGTLCLLAITRMQPDLTALRIEYLDEVTAVI